MSILSIVNYVLLALMAVLAVAALRKDWEDYKQRKLHVTVAAVTVAVAVLSIANLYLSNREADKDKRSAEAKAEKDRSDASAREARLEGQITGGQNTAVAAINNMRAEVTNLQSQIKTQDLRRYANRLQKDLEETQEALAKANSPAPKASLSFTFVPFKDVMPAPPELVTRKLLPIGEDGSVAVEFTVLNMSDVDALDGDITLHICDGCKLLKEIPGWAKLGGDAERTHSFDRLLAVTKIPTITANIVPPSTTTAFLIGITYRCHTCVVGKEPVTGTVTIVGRVPTAPEKFKIKPTPL